MKSDSIIYEGIFPSRGYNGLWMCCDLLIEKTAGAYLVTFSERTDNTGMSVTNLSEQLASEVVAKFGLEPCRCEFFEKYTYPDKADRLDRINYRFERVGGSWVATGAYWQYMAG
jgi:hypothetical protein